MGREINHGINIYTHNQLKETMIISPYRIRIHIDSLKPKKLGFFERILFRNSGKEAFVVSKRYVLGIRFEALTSIPCARIIIIAEWTSQRRDFYEFDIGPMDIGEITTPSRSLEFGVIEPGYGLIFIDAKGSPRESDLKIPYANRSDLHGVSFYLGDEVIQKNNPHGAHIESVFGQTSEEFYQYWAMILAVIALWEIILSRYIGYIADVFLVLIMIVMIIRSFRS